MLRYIFPLLCLALMSKAYTVLQPEITLLEPKGIRFAYPEPRLYGCTDELSGSCLDDGSVNMVSYHYSINQELNGVAAGQYNVDVNSPTGGYFVHENTAVSVTTDDVVYYWLNVITTGGGYTLTDQVWQAEDSTTTTTTTKATTTTGTTTKQSTTTQATTSSGGGSQTTQAPVVTTDAGNTETTTSGSNGGGGGTCTGVAAACDSYPCDSACDQSQPPCNGLIFEENWDTFDLTRWEHEITMSGGGNWEFEYYTNNRTNSYVRDNTLFIKPTLTADHYGEAYLSSGTIDLWGAQPADVCTSNAFWGCQRTGSGSNYLNPIQSARLRSVKSFSFKYGKVEVFAQMPKGDWIWPAIWFLPKTQQYGVWPASGEIDLVESRGNAPNEIMDTEGVSRGYDEIGSTLHWGPYFGANRYDLTHASVHASNGDFGTGFHNYTTVWTDQSMEFHIDGEKILTVDPGQGGFWEFGEFETNQPGSFNPWSVSPNKMAPFDQEFYFVINVAVGGTTGYWPDNWTYARGKPWSNVGESAFRDFWNAKNNWYPTWKPDENNGEGAAMKVKTIKVWAYDP